MLQIYKKHFIYLLYILMKILVKYAGKRKRTVIDVSPDALIRDVKLQIQTYFKLQMVPFRLLTTLACDCKVLLTESFPISFFNFSNGDSIEVDAYGYKLMKSRRKSRNSTFLDILGLPITYPSSENPVLDHIIESCKRGNYIDLRETIENFNRSNPGEDILDQTHRNLWKPLHYACYYGHAQIVRYLVENHVNVNRVTVDEWTALQLSCYRGHLQCAVNLFHHKNLQVNKMTKFRGTSLHLACEQNDTETVKFLLSRNAYIALKDSSGRTPFDLTTNREILNLLAVATGEQEIKRCSDFELLPLITEVWLTGIFFIHDRPVVLVLDTDSGCLKRYAGRDQYQDKATPEVSISLPDIQDIREEEEVWPFSNKDQYYFVVETSKFTNTYYTRHKLLTAEWIQRLKIAVDYFLVNHTKHNSNRDTLNTSISESATEDKPNIAESAPVNTETVNFESFDVLEEIGSGSFGTVYRVQKKNEDKVYAMKSLSKRTLEVHRQLKYAISECKIMKQLNHPFILTLHYAFQTKKFLYLVLDYCSCGDLLEIIRSQGKLSEKASRFYLAEVILALEYLHSMDILYRDLKPSNILIDSTGNVKLADFGLAKENVRTNNPAMSMAGTPAYLPPETINGRGTTHAADIYGLGPLLYEMLTGTPLFSGNDTCAIYNSIRLGRIAFPPYVDEAAKNLINQVMNRNPERRLTINQLKRHFFFRRLNWQALFEKKIKPPKITHTQVDTEVLI